MCVLYRQPSVVEIQILRVGQFLILCVPGELTTMAGRRLREAVQAQVLLWPLRIITWARRYDHMSLHA